MLKRFVSLGAAALAAVVAACEDGPATVAGGWRSAATWSSMVYASVGGPVWVQVHGQPFPQGGDDFRRAVALAMSRQLVGRVLDFTAAAEEAPRPQFRVVLAFNPPLDAEPAALCAGRVATLAPPGETVSLLAAFCGNDALLSWGRGRVGRVAGADHPRFRRLLGQVVRDLFGSPS